MVTRNSETSLQKIPTFLLLTQRKQIFERLNAIKRTIPQSGVIYRSSRSQYDIYSADGDLIEELSRKTIQDVDKYNNNSLFKSFRCSTSQTVFPQD